MQERRQDTQQETSYKVAEEHVRVRKANEEDSDSPAGIFVAATDQHRSHVQAHRKFLDKHGESLHKDAVAVLESHIRDHEAYMQELEDMIEDDQLAEVGSNDFVR